MLIIIIIIIIKRYIQSLIWLAAGTNSTSQSALRQGSSTLIGPALRQRPWAPALSCGAWTGLSVVAALSVRGRAAQEEAVPRSSCSRLRLNEGLRPCGGSRSLCCPALPPSWCTCGWRTDAPPPRRTALHTPVLFNPGVLWTLSCERLANFTFAAAFY